jgi:polysaccharide biosynthesis transport protein
MDNRWSNEEFPPRLPLRIPAYRDIQPAEVYDVSGSPASSDNLLAHARLLRRYKWIIASFAFLGALAGLGISLFQTPIYEARLSMEVQNFNQDFLDVGKVDPTTVNYEADSYLQTQMKMIQSDGLLDRVVARVPFNDPNADTPESARHSWVRGLLGLPQIQGQTPRQKAISLALNTLRVRGSGMTRLIEVYCSSTNPHFAADFCNTLSEEFLEQSLEVRWNSAQRVTNWLTQQLAGLKNTLQLSEGRLNEFIRRTGVLSGSDKDNLAAQRLTQLEDEVFRAQADRVSKQSKYELAMSSQPDTLPEVLDDASLRDYQMKFMELRRQYAELSSVLTANHPQVKRVEAQLHELTSGLEHHRENILSRVRNEYEQAVRREDLLQKEYSEQLKKVADQTSNGVQYNALKRDVDSTRDLYESLLRRFKEAGVAAAMRVSNIRVVDRAKIPSVPSKPNRRLDLGLGVTTGLFLGLGFIFVRDRIDSSLKNPGDAKFYLNTPELGMIPAAGLDKQLVYGRRLAKLSITDTPEHSEACVELVTWQNKYSFTAESYRSVLTSILFRSERENGSRPRALLVTSPGPRDGKTTTLSNLGISLAETLVASNKRVLLIDGDLRRPRLHGIFDRAASPGLGELLAAGSTRQDLSLDSFIRSTAVPGLWLLPAGTADGPVTKLIYSTELPKLLVRLRQEFDTLLVDAPPLVALPDARILARWVDAVLLVVRSVHTDRELATTACEQLRDDGAPLLGTILNDWNPRKAGAAGGHAKEYISSYRRYYRALRSS